MSGLGCPCGHKLMFCHAENARRWCGGAEVPADVVLERDRLREALVRCATVAGADVSGGPPTWPPVEVWAVQEVEQLRRDYDEALQ